MRSVQGREEEARDGGYGRHHKNDKSPGESYDGTLPRNLKASQFNSISKPFSLLQEYEENTSPESKFIKDLDRLDMVLQAFEYEKRDNCVGKHKEFVDTVHGKSLHPLVGSLIDEIKAQREALMKNEEDRQSS